MPNCFQFSSKDTGLPVKLHTIDEELCTLLGVPVHSDNWVCYWYDCLGFPLAMGKTLTEIKNDLAKDLAKSEEKEAYTNLIKICEYLDEKYTTDSWAEIGRR